MKTHEWNSDDMLARWRAAWAARQNEALERRGFTQRVDHRSLAVRRRKALERGDRVAAATLDRAPEIHVGPKDRKASRQQAPKSKIRLVGRNLKKGKRPLRYDLIDHGSRREWNMRTLRRNAKAYGRLVARTETTLARMRQRLQRYDRVLKLHSLHRLPRRRSQPVDVVDLVFSPASRYEHVRKRRAQLLWMIDQLDRLFLALLGIRESQLTRNTEWANRLRRRSHLLAPPVLGRYRVKPRSL
ncbi:hypothetical protein BCCGELA001_30300 [Bradyrhizobium sp. CCGE-LA001]|nr:hypothetical protein BCCGELA001_30300 [Bradyrhizobium sp. CCGE-LA001]